MCYAHDQEVAGLNPSKGRKKFQERTTQFDFESQLNGKHKGVASLTVTAKTS